MVEIELVLLDVLKKGVVNLGGEGPGFPVRPVGVVFGFRHGRFVDVGFPGFGEGEPSVTFEGWGFRSVCFKDSAIITFVHCDRESHFADFIPCGKGGGAPGFRA